MLRTVDSSSELERSLQTKVYDLQSLSAALSMLELFARQAKEIFPLLEELVGQAAANEYRRRFADIVREYEILGMPKRLRGIEDRAFHARVRQFSHDLLSYVEAAFPIRVEQTLSRAAT